MKKLAILGSTGSLGRQALQVISDNTDLYSVVSLTAHHNEQLLNQQVSTYRPQCWGLSSTDNRCLLTAVQQDIDMAVVLTGGIDSLPAIIYCIEHNIDIALANKEALVCAGQLIMSMLQTSSSRLIPIDSEHSAIWQCLQGTDCAPSAITLTASGGAFVDYSKRKLSTVTPLQAQTHPKWSMGADITLDSNTMFNKTLEVLEARWLFNVPIDRINIVVHRQSIVHSLVTFNDGSTLAQLSYPDMRLPIKYALDYPIRLLANLPQLDMATVSRLTFEKPNSGRFPCVNLCYNPIYNNGLMPTVLIGANEIARTHFRQCRIDFNHIYWLIDKVATALYDRYKGTDVTLDSIYEAYNYSKQYAMQL
ncbi:MAG: 1-deoxy-D-xylulose-5-phosphate reductoisomerase [Clostridia bacterium]|nr:1-deoxy-D-xylulose-5-phosphate reductoisomerase [Clostridia bacterium]